MADDFRLNLGQLRSDMPLTLEQPIMIPSTTDSSLDAAIKELSREQAHASMAPAAFLEAWTRGAQLAGTHLFGNEPVRTSLRLQANGIYVRRCS